MASSRAEEELAGRQAQEGRERVEALERELREACREAAALKGQLAATEEVNCLCVCVCVFSLLRQLVNIDRDVLSVRH